MPLDARSILSLSLENGVSQVELRAAIDDAQDPSGADVSDATVGITPPANSTVPADTPRITGLARYDDLGGLGMGGMGEVRRVRDRRLGQGPGSTGHTGGSHGGASPHSDRPEPHIQSPDSVG